MRAVVAALALLLAACPAAAQEAPAAVGAPSILDDDAPSAAPAPSRPETVRFTLSRGAPEFEIVSGLVDLGGLTRSSAVETASVDLNGDGVAEVLGRVRGPAVCGSAGCLTWAWTWDDAAAVWRNVWTGRSLRLAADVPPPEGGWRDLLVQGGVRHVMGPDGTYGIDPDALGERAPFHEASDGPAVEAALRDLPEAFPSADAERGARVLVAAVPDMLEGRSGVLVSIDDGDCSAAEGGACPLLLYPSDMSRPVWTGASRPGVAVVGRSSTLGRRDLIVSDATAHEVWSWSRSGWYERVRRLPGPVGSEP